MNEKDAGEDTRSREELSRRLESYQQELEHLTAEYPDLLARQLRERTELVELLKRENNADTAEELWKKYDNSGTTFSTWIEDHQHRIAELTKKIQETNDLLWKSRETTGTGKRDA